MGKFNIEGTKGKATEIKENLDTKKTDLENAKESKQALLDAQTEIQGANLDDQSLSLVKNLLDNAIVENTEKAKQISLEMNEDLSKLEEMKQEVDDSTQENITQRSKLEGTKSVLDKFGLGDKLDPALAELDKNKDNLDSVNQELNDIEKDLMDISMELQNI